MEAKSKLQFPVLRKQKQIRLKPANKPTLVTTSTQQQNGAGFGKACNFPVNFSLQTVKDNVKTGNI
jgi:hypothetical protein